MAFLPVSLRRETYALTVVTLADRLFELILILDYK